MNICQHCSTIQKTCCQQSDIIATDKDIERISSKGYKDFYGFYKPQSYDYGQEEDPNWDKYTINKNGTMQMINKTPEGNCIFLGSYGCLLDLETRPVICRIYPYYYNEEQILELDPYKCPKGVIQSDEEWLKTNLSVDSQSAEKWRKQFYLELKEGKIHNENRNML